MSKSNPHTTYYVDLLTVCVPAAGDDDAYHRGPGEMLASSSSSAAAAVGMWNVNTSSYLANCETLPGAPAPAAAARVDMLYQRIQQIQEEQCRKSQ